MKGKSTEGAVSNTVNYIESHLFRGNICVGVFLDIKSAYDSMDVHQIRSSLLLHGGEDDIVEWYYHYLKNRIIEIELHSETVYLHTNAGFPQGGVASAKFWVIAFDPAIQIITLVSLKVLGMRMIVLLCSEDLTLALYRSGFKGC